MRWRLAKKIDLLTYKYGIKIPTANPRHVSAKNKIKQYQYNRMIDYFGPHKKRSRIEFLKRRK